MIDEIEKIGFIGAGNMASALISGLINNGIPPAGIMASSPEEDHLKNLTDNYGIKTTNKNKEIINESEIIILAVKPNILESVLTEVNSLISFNKHLIISIAAGCKITDIESKFSSKQRIIRAMPNTPASIKEGITAITLNKQATQKDKQNAEKLFSCVGEVLSINEKDMDAYTALIGSGPAYVFYFIESLLESCNQIDLDETTKKNMITSMISGSANLARKSEDTPETLRKKVTSPGGVTQRAIEEFETQEMKKIIVKAIKEATVKSKELGEN
ncbi:MAG: pyrroline-5-carboxylate reductase [Gammaproteobacteria bacterium]|nr:pyrroline-5-carboxylate reductase [Gammaproteobacteria bacterium]HJL95799.1 pyrroline-5-carboxylate reductase [SAR86 cluster bacterium]|tara:strand:- start:554 stop:1372 length:819 start_codon:yes stop_codon:yes gene_type:complete